MIKMLFLLYLLYSENTQPFKIKSLMRDVNHIIQSMPKEKLINRINLT